MWVQRGFRNSVERLQSQKWTGIAVAGVTVGDIKPEMNAMMISKLFDDYKKAGSRTAVFYPCSAYISTALFILSPCGAYW